MQPEQDFFLSTERYFSKFTEKAAAAIAQALPATSETARQPRRKPQPPANAREESYTPNFPLLFPLPGGSWYPYLRLRLAHRPHGRWGNGLPFGA